VPGNPLTPFSLLVKPSGAACNLACEYCFYLSREQLYPGSHFRMSDQVLEAYIRQILDSQPSQASLDWQGGEPTLMGLDFFKRSINLLRRVAKPGQKVSFSLQTNGVLLDEAWCTFFKENDFLIGLSLDGPPALHDAYRRDKGGRGTYAQVQRAWNLLQKHRVKTNILCAVHAANAAYPLEVYRFFRDILGARFIQFIPIVERLKPQIPAQPVSGQGGRRPRAARQGSQVSLRSVEARQFGLFLIQIFDEWLHSDVGGIFIQQFDSALAAWCGVPASVCIFQETCGRSLVLEHNGDLYACDHFVLPSRRLGNILEKPLRELVDLPSQHRFGLDKRDRLPEFCRACDVYFACRGECPRNRFLRTPDGAAGLNYLCAGYRLFFEHIDQPMRTMAALLRQGRTPAEIMWDRNRL
jgi:uncharacterized protein